MNAGEVIAAFVDVAGRYDFVDGDDVPKDKAYLCLNAAQRWLDREVRQPNECAWLYKEVPAGETLIKFAHARYVKDVYSHMMQIPWQTVQFGLDTDDRNGLTQGITIPKSERDRTIRILSAWYSPELTDTDDVSFWSAQHPELLIRAMQMQCEIDMRNTQGVNDFMEPLKYDCAQLYRDIVAEEMGGTTEYWRMD